MLPDAMEEDDDSEGSDDDDDIVMPDGPAPYAETSDSDDSDTDIPMPPGPPPPRDVPPLPKGRLFIHYILRSHCFMRRPTTTTTDAPTSATCIYEYPTTCSTSTNGILSGIS